MKSGNVTQPPVKRWRELLASERDAAALYQRLAAAERGERQQIFRDLSEMAADERGHARTLARLLDGGKPGPVEQIARRERWHRGDRSGALRAGVFGVSDGLVSNTALVMGFAGSGASRTVALLAGVAGLLAGAFSM